ncbi:type II toxin-antitoxin system RelE/ParE family toxin [bacterium]|nr:type II toxin-antitoxin system RelE/ParE family toxin [bacterium]
MAEVRWTAQAVDDLDAIARFIEGDSPHYASLFVIDVLGAAEGLAQFPLSGRVVPEAADPSVREALLGNYRLVYRVQGEMVEMLTIYHRARLLDPSEWTTGRHDG